MVSLYTELKTKSLKRKFITGVLINFDLHGISELLLNGLIVYCSVWPISLCTLIGRLMDFNDRKLIYQFRYLNVLCHVCAVWLSIKYSGD